MSKCCNIYEVFISLGFLIFVLCALRTPRIYTMGNNKNVIKFVNNIYSHSEFGIGNIPECVISNGYEPSIIVGIIAIKIESKGGLRFKIQFVELIKSILDNTKSKIHFVLFSNPVSLITLLRVMKKISLKFGNGIRCPTYEIFNVSTVGRQFKNEMNHLKLYFTAEDDRARKYSEDFFMIAPFLHRSLPFRRFIMLDVDLFFRTDIKELFLLFDRFRETEAAAFSLDLAPHYYHVLRFYRGVNPGTQIGLPGRFQGLNTGVALYNFAHLRSNVKFNEYITLKGRNLPDLDQLAAKFLFKSHLGDQCFFTLLSLEHPDLFRILDCGYNFQLDESMFRDPWESRFYAYHNCTSKPKVYHMNGGSEILSGARLLAD